MHNAGLEAHGMKPRGARLWHSHNFTEIDVGHPPA